MHPFRESESDPDDRTGRRRVLVLLGLAGVAPRLLAADAGTGGLLVLGDSLSAAYGLPTEAGWVALLRRRLAAAPRPVRVVNASVSGETTSGGATRIDALMERERPAAVLVALGANDALRGLSLSDMRANLLRIVRSCRRGSARVLLVGMRLPPNYGRAFDERFRAVFEEVAAAERADLVPFLLEGLEDRRDLFQSDGLHPVAEAQPMILEHLWPAVRRLLGT
jgi:acyl-CoA thioesterase I